MIHNKRFPNETAEYRKSRDTLLEEEIKLRENIESINKIRQSLPLGGAIKENYTFQRIKDGEVKELTLSDCFKNNKNTLVIYSFMYGPDMEKPCPACTSVIDTLNANVSHLTDRINLVVVAKSPITRIYDFAKLRKWNDIQLLSSSDNTYNRDYYAENDKGNQIPALNVFVKKDGKIHHFYNTELLYVDLKGHPRHVDSIWPIWNVLDLTPDGRGTDWFPKLEY